MRLKSVSTGRHLLSVLTLGAAVFALAGATLAQPAVAATGAAAKTAAPARSASRFAATIRDGRAAANALLDLTKAPSLSLALVSNGQVVWQQGFGYADLDTHTPPGPDTMYGIGSVSKMFAAVAAMKLVDQGKLALDAPVAAYLPTFTMLTPGYRSVTVRMLLDHSSGFPGSCYEDSSTGEYWPGYVAEVMDTLANSRLKSTPGFLSVYCNDGFTLVEALVPAVTGKSYAQFVQDEILTPLGMTHSAFPLAPFPDGSYAKAYTDGKANPREVLNVLASGAAYSTPSDMSRLAIMFANGGAYGGTRILSATAVTEMGKDQTARSFSPVDYEATRYGLGWDSVKQPGLKAVGVTAWMKGGDASDYHAAIIVAPKQKLSAVALGVTPLSSGALETLCERVLLHALVDRGLLRRVPEPMAPGAPPAKTASEAQLAGIEGYWAGNGLVLHVHAPGSNPQVLDADMLGQTGWGPWFAGLRLRTDNGFHRKGNVNSLRTVTGAGRRYLALRLASGTGFYFDDMPLAQKVRPGEPISAAWQTRVGHFWLTANEQPQSSIYTANGGPLLAVRDVPGLSGYVTVTTSSFGLQIVDPSESADAALMFLQIPGFGSRDMNDAVIVRVGGEDWIQYGAAIYRPMDGVPGLAEGANAVTFDAASHTEWRTVPAAGHLTISAGSAWRLYDADMAVLAAGTSFPATAEASAGSYLALFGPAASNTTVTLTLPVGGQSVAPTPAAPRHLTVPLPRPALAPLAQEVSP